VYPRDLLAVYFSALLQLLSRRAGVHRNVTYLELPSGKIMKFIVSGGV
jgi:hypothetical protein